VSRKSKFSAAVVAKIVEGLRKAMPRKYAAARAGIGERTFHDWLEQKPDFALKCAQAEAYAVEHALELMEKRGKGQWTQPAWLLERRFAESYGKAERLQIDSNVNVNVLERRQLILQGIVGKLPAGGVERIVEAMKPEDERLALPPGDNGGKA